jgi:ribosomal protein S16
MSVKIRLSRHGKKNHAFFHIVVADERAPRDGRFIEVLGTYNPNTNPAAITLDGEKALNWLNVGAQPTDTCRRILSYKGVLLKKHLQGGVAKGSLTQEQADAKYNAWVAEKEAKVNSKKESLAKKASENKQASIEAENKVNVARAEVIAKKKAEEAAAKAEAEAKAKAEAEAAAQVEEQAAEVAEAPAAEAQAEEASAEEAK